VVRATQTRTISLDSKRVESGLPGTNEDRLARGQNPALRLGHTGCPGGDACRSRHHCAAPRLSTIRLRKFPTAASLPKIPVCLTAAETSELVRARCENRSSRSPALRIRGYASVVRISTNKFCAVVNIRKVNPF
jgi:hypothetical protein